MELTTLVNSAQQLYLQGNYQKSLQLLQEAVLIAPNHAIAQTNLSYLAFLNGKLSLALEAGQLAVKLSPESADAKINYASALCSFGDAEAAIVQLENAILINPSSALGWTQLNLAYQQVNQYSEAVAAGQRAIQCDPNLIHSYSNLALTLQQLGEANKAKELLETALTINPKVSFLHHNYLMNLQYLAHINSQEMYLAAKKYADSLNSKNNFITIKNKIPCKLNVGYISGDFRKHPVGWFIHPIIAEHRQSQINSYVYANQQVFDEQSENIKANCCWREIIDLTDQEVIKLIKKDGIDILVDLSGHTGGNRLGIFAMGAAAVQVSWLGYFASTGLSSIDYVLLNENQITESIKHYFTESVYALKGSQFCYHPPSYAPKVAPPPFQENGYITFGSFNNTAKINDEVLRHWATILLYCTMSKLIIKWSIFDDQTVQNQFIKKFSLYGIDSNRLELRGSSTHIKMLEEYGDIDIALDTFPFSGGLTSCEALWMGIPIITFPQLRPVSRQTYGLLKTIGLENLAGYTPNEYIKIATELAKDKPRLTVLRKNLRQYMTQSCLMNSQYLAAEIEHAYIDIYSHKSNKC